jgi:hypothetical protein
MKFSASFALFGISAFAALTPNHADIVSASEYSSENNNSNIKNDSNNVVSEISSMPSMAPTVPASSLADLLDPSGGTHLSLLGLLDPSEPLTEAEAAFLEGTVRDAFNKFHEEMGIDLYADSVTVGIDDGIVTNHNDNDASSSSSSSNLRGASRNLERNIYGTPGPDIRPCTHHSGPLKGYGIEGCVWDIEIFLDCRCWMCLDDDFEIGVVAHRDWTPAPYYDFFRFLDDDDDYFSATPSQVPSSSPSQVPSFAPSVAPTEEEDEDNSIGLEEERGPGEPNMYLPPSSPTPNGDPEEAPAEPLSPLPQAQEGRLWERLLKATPCLFL